MSRLLRHVWVRVPIKTVCLSVWHEDYAWENVTETKTQKFQQRIACGAVCSQPTIVGESVRALLHCSPGSSKQCCAALSLRALFQWWRPAASRRPTAIPAWGAQPVAGAQLTLQAQRQLALSASTCTPRLTATSPSRRSIAPPVGSVSTTTPTMPRSVFPRLEALLTSPGVRSRVLPPRRRRLSRARLRHPSRSQPTNATWRSRRAPRPSLASRPWASARCEQRGTLAPCKVFIAPLSTKLLLAKRAAPPTAHRPCFAVSSACRRPSAR